MSLPKYQTNDQALSLVMTNWPTQLNPVINSPLATPIILKSVVLKTGANTINHMLGAPLQGWIVNRKRGEATIYDEQDVNPLPASTLILHASSGVTVDLTVF